MQLFKRVLLPFLWGKGTFSVPSKVGEAVCLLAEKAY